MSSTSLTPSTRDPSTAICSPAAFQNVWSRGEVWTGLGLFLFASLMFFNEANFRLADGSDFRLDWQILLRLGLCGACGLYGVMHLPRTLPQLFRFPAAWFTLTCIWIILTIPIALNRTHAAGSGAALWCAVLFVPALMTRVGRKQIVFTVAGTLTLLLVASWFVFFVFPELGRDQYLYHEEVDEGYRLGGLSHPNGTGMQAAMLLLSLLVIAAEKWLDWWRVAPWVLFAGATLLATDCRTAIVALVPVTLLFCLRNVKNITIFYLLCSVLCIGGMWLVIGLDHDRALAGLSRSGDSTEMYKLNGRMELWPLVIAKIGESPLWGYGYGCQRFVISHLGLEWASFHAHNLLLHNMLGLGLLGGALFIGMLVALLVDLLRRPAHFPDLVVLFVVIGGLADTMIFSPLPDVFTMIWLLALFWRLVPDPAGSVAPSLSTGAAG